MMCDECGHDCKVRCLEVEMFSILLSLIRYCLLRNAQPHRVCGAKALPVYAGPRGCLVAGRTVRLEPKRERESTAESCTEHR